MARKGMARSSPQNLEKLTIRRNCSRHWSDLQIRSRTVANPGNVSWAIPRAPLGVSESKNFNAAKDPMACGERYSGSEKETVLIRLMHLRLIGPSASLRSQCGRRRTHLVGVANTVIRGLYPGQSHRATPCWLISTMPSQMLSPLSPLPTRFAEAECSRTHEYLSLPKSKSHHR
jgi:hypothetical protein